MRPLPYMLTYAHAGSQARVTSMGGLYDTATLHALWNLVFADRSALSHNSEAPTNQVFFKNLY